VLVTVKKTFRQGQIVNLIRSQAIRTQEELAAALKKVGIDVTQVTLSRDIHELGLMKGPQGYQEAQAINQDSRPEEGSLQWVFEEFVRDVALAANMVIIKTGYGNASVVAEALDREGWPEVAGTIAGENTIFVACTSSKQAVKVKGKVLALMK
jgi:transcriptional regulator of arginine metabolism